MIYIIVFFSSILCFMIASIFKKNNKKKLFYIFTGIAVFIPCYLASRRDVTIGTDVTVYVEGWHKYALQISSITRYFNNVGYTEFLYQLVNFVISRAFKNFSILLFTYQFLNIIPLVIAFNKIDKKISVPFAMLLYFLFFYNMSFNIVRQSISISFLILAVVYLMEKNEKNFFIFFIVSFLFHSSSIIGLFLWLLYKNSKSKYFKLYVFIYLVIIVFVLLNFRSSIELLITLKVLPEKYYSYINKFMFSEANFSLFNNVFYFVVLIIMFLGNNLKERNNKFLFYSYILGILLFESGIISHFANRISYALIYPPIFILLSQIGKKMKSKKLYLPLSLLIIMLFIFYWYFWIVYVGIHETYPFVFA